MVGAMIVASAADALFRDPSSSGLGCSRRHSRDWLSMSFETTLNRGSAIEHIKGHEFTGKEQTRRDPKGQVILKLAAMTLGGK